MIDFQKTEPNRKPNSLTAVNRKGQFLTFLAKFEIKLGETAQFRLVLLNKPETLNNLSKIIAHYGLSTFRSDSKNVGFCLKKCSITADG